MVGQVDLQGRNRHLVARRGVEVGARAGIARIARRTDPVQRLAARRAIAVREYLVSLGANLAICGRRRDVLDKTAAEISPAGGVLALSCDVRQPEQVEAMFIGRQPMGRLGPAEEIAAMAVYFASDDSRFTTGTAALVDGGWSL